MRWPSCGSTRCSLPARTYTFTLGSYYYDSQRWADAIDAFAQYPLRKLKTPEDYEASYRLAYSYLQNEQYVQAERIFRKLGKSGNERAAVSSYYAGYLAYTLQKPAEALSLLEQAAADPRLVGQVEGLLPAVYYKQGLCPEVVSYANELAEAGQALQPTVYLLSADCYYQYEDYPNAARAFDAYAREESRDIAPEIYYRMGYAHLKAGNYHRAEPYLSTAADGEDALAQAAAYHLGVSFVANAQKEDALIAFDKARRLDHEPRLQEQSAFQFTKLAFDVGDYPLAIEGSEFYRQIFPEGPELQEVYQLATEAYLRTGDYQNALYHIDQLSSRSQRMLEAYQEIAYNKAVLDYNDENYRSAVDMLKKSLTQPYDKNLVSLANYWLGETYSYGNKYDSALMYYARVAPGSAAYNRSLYGKGFAQYNLKNYPDALQTFRSYIQSAATTEPERKVDAILRLADTYYVSKDFENALRLYDLALRNDHPNTEYIYYQQALAYLGASRIDRAIEQLDKQMATFSQGRLMPQALFRKGQIYFENGRRQASLRYFQQLTQQYPQSTLVLPAHFRMGLATREAGDLDGAVLHYSAILEADPAHYLAESALESLSGIAATGYQVPNLARYRTNFLAANPNSDFEIAQAFASAKAPFNNREYELAVESLSTFIQQYPQSSYAQEANYMLGYTFEILEQDARAVERYEQIKSGPFRTKAVRRLADLSLNSQRFNEAILYYLELLDKESSSRVREKALIGLLEAYYTINDYEAAQQYINQIEEEKLSRLSNEAKLYQGKIYLARQQYQQAVVQFQEVAQKASNSTGAEAQYLLGKTFRQLGDFDNSTVALIDVRNNFQSYTEWIYEAYLLIAENYISKGDTFQAKATLNSIVSNSISPEYQERAQQRLAQLEKNKNSGSK